MEKKKDRQGQYSHQQRQVSSFKLVARAKLGKLSFSGWKRA